MTSPATTRPEVAAAPIEDSRHGPIAQLLIAWSPLSAILVAYWVAQWITAPLGVGDGADTNRLGASLHVLGGEQRGEHTLTGASGEQLEAVLGDPGAFTERARRSATLSAQMHAFRDGGNTRRVYDVIRARGASAPKGAA